MQETSFILKQKTRYPRTVNLEKKLYTILRNTPCSMEIAKTCGLNIVSVMLNTSDCNRLVAWFVTKRVAKLCSSYGVYFYATRRK